LTGFRSFANGVAFFVGNTAGAFDIQRKIYGISNQNGRDALACA